MALRSAVPSLATCKLSFEQYASRFMLKMLKPVIKLLGVVFYFISLRKLCNKLISLVVGKGRKITWSLRDSLACLWQRRQPGLSLKTLAESSPGLCVLRNSFLRNLGLTAFIDSGGFSPFISCIVHVFQLLVFSSWTSTPLSWSPSLYPSALNPEFPQLSFPDASFCSDCLVCFISKTSQYIIYNVLFKICLSLPMAQRIEPRTSFVFRQCPTTELNPKAPCCLSPSSGFGEHVFLNFY